MRHTHTKHGLNAGNRLVKKRSDFLCNGALGMVVFNPCLVLIDIDMTGAPIIFSA